MTDEPAEPDEPPRTPPRGATPRRASPGHRPPVPAHGPHADRRPSARVALAARLLDQGRDPVDVAALTGVPWALLQLHPPRPAPPPGDHRSGAGQDRYAAAVTALRRQQRLRRAAFGVAVGFGLNAGLALAALGSGNVELARVSTLVTALLGAAWLLILLTTRRIHRNARRTRPAPRGGPGPARR